MKTTLLCILDGFGIREEVHGNAVKQANTPNFDYLWNKYPHSLLHASGKLVGLPDGQYGNSEVGHMNIGAGRIVYQPLEYINQKISTEEFYENEELLKVIKHVQENDSRLHIMGLLSDGGVHSHIDHFLAALELAKRNNIKKVYFHIFTDGRDTYKDVAMKYIDRLTEEIENQELGEIASISGRYYAMDRDNNWDRIKKAYDAIVTGTAPECMNIPEMIEESYKNGVYDEFIEPHVVNEKGNIRENDGVIWINYRPDRAREILKTITNKSFNDFKTIKFSNVLTVTMMPTSDEVVAKNAFKIEDVINPAGPYLDSLGIKQLRIAETEKYAHVTYFFDGGKELELKNATRILIPSPKVATYDLKPEMSAYEITERLLNEIGNYDFIVLNFANPDMVGHTGVMEAAIKAIETVDECLGKIKNKIDEVGGTLIVTADHGNADYMLDENNTVITSHSSSLVPFIICRDGLKLKNGKLGDIMPTILKLMNIPIPKEMTGDILIGDE